MDRRSVLMAAGSALGGAPTRPSPAGAAEAPRTPPRSRRRPGQPGWPSEATWDALNRKTGGRLIKPHPPLAACREAPDGPACREQLRRLRNPYHLGDEPALTQTSGWAGAWTSSPSAYAVAARTAADVAAAVGFAREHDLRLVVKGGGHSYQGTSNAPDSLLVWTRAMDAIALHESFVPENCEGHAAPQPAVSVGAGAIWMRVYDAVTTRAGRFVQGGGCTTVGVAGLVQSGGFGPFSKAYGTAAAGLLEAEVVTADGAVRVANARTHPDLFWALKGGGGGTFGVATRLTLRTHPLPEFFGAVFGRVRAASDAAFRRLVERFAAFYAERLFDPRWGETATFRPDNMLAVSMVFAGLDQRQAEDLWRPFLAWLAGSPEDFAMASPFQIRALPSRRLWDAEWLRGNTPGLVVADDRPGAPLGDVFWAGDAGQVGQFLYGYESAWLPAPLLAPDARPRLCDALFRASRHRPVSLHFNKGLAGATPETLAAARDTAMHPSALDAFALAISAAGGPPAFPGQPGPLPDLPAAMRGAAAVAAAMDEFRAAAPGAGSYLSESNYFQRDWQDAFWGPSYPKLLETKRRHDPSGLFFVHHGVGSEGWSADGFTKGA